MYWGVQFYSATSVHFHSAIDSYEKMRGETPKTPQNAPFIKRGILKKPCKTPGFYRGFFVG